MRIILAILGLAPLLAACEAAGPVAAVGLGSVALIGRTPVDVVASLVTGRDCSAVRLDRRQSYCAPTEQPPAAQPYCTRSLGSVDCWTVPPHAIPPYRGVAEGPDRLTPAQEADRTAWGPGLSAALASAAAPAPAPVTVIVAPPPVVIAPVEAAPVVRAEPIPNPPARPPQPRRRAQPAARPACPCPPQPAAAPAPSPTPAAAPAPAAPVPAPQNP